MNNCMHGAVVDVFSLYCCRSHVRVMRWQFFKYFFYLSFFLNSSSLPVYCKTGFLTRESTRSDLPWYTMKFNDFYAVLIGIEWHEECRGLFFKSTR